MRFGVWVEPERRERFFELALHFHHLVCQVRTPCGDGRHLFDCLLSVVQIREFMVENMRVLAKPAGDVEIEA